MPFHDGIASDHTFTFNKAELNNAAKHQIDREVLQPLAECKDVESITITGCTDKLGSIRSNQIISEKRAKAVGDYLQTKGVIAKTNVVGAGSSQALKLCSEKINASQID